MDNQRVGKYWEEEAEEALKVATHLLEKGDYSYALFFGHLAVEKILKALYVSRKGEQAPYSHNLARLAEGAGIELSETRITQLITVTAYNLESRYPDEKRSFREKCTEGFTKNELSAIKELFAWLKSMLKS